MDDERKDRISALSGGNPLFKMMGINIDDIGGGLANVVTKGLSGIIPDMAS